MPLLLMILFFAAWLICQNVYFARHWLKELELALNFSDTHVTQFDRACLDEVVTNRKRMPLPWLQIRFQLPQGLRFDRESGMAVSDNNYAAEVFFIGGGRRVTRTRSFSCEKRGCYTLTGITLTAQTPLATRRYTVTLPDSRSLIVLPAPLEYELCPPAYRQWMGEMRARRFIHPDPFAFRGIRAYCPSDPLRMINHKATAKTGDWMVNTLDSTSTQTAVIWLNSQPFTGFPYLEVYESAIRLAAAAAEELIGLGMNVAFRSTACSILAPGISYAVPEGTGPRHLFKLLEGLAFLDLEKPCEPLSLLLSQAPPKDGLHIFISSYNGADFAEAFQTLSRSGLDVFWIMPRPEDFRTDTHENCVLWIP